jgi:O-antigen/teichoic acid export membrane protein
MSTLGTLVNILYPVLVYPYATRKLGPGGLGTVGIATSTVQYFVMIAQIGIPTYGIRACAALRDDREKLSRCFREIYLLSLITTAFALLAYFLTVRAVPQFRAEGKLYAVLAGYILLNTLGAEWLYKGLEQYSYIAARTLIFRLTALAGVYMLVRGSSDYIIYGFLTHFALMAGSLLNLLLMGRLIDWRIDRRISFGRHIRPAFVFFGMSVATTIYTNMDNVMLGLLRGNVESGYYVISIKVKTVLVTLITSVGTVLLSRITYYLDNGRKDRFMTTVSWASELMMILAVPVSLFFIIFAEPITLFISGAEFAPSVLPMQILMPTLVLIGITNITGIQVMVPMKMEKKVLQSEIVGAAVNMIVNFMLIPPFGAAGAAAGTLVAETAVMITQFLSLKDSLPQIFDARQILRAVPAAAGAALISLLAENSFLNQLTESVQALSRLTLIASEGVLFFGSYFLLLILLREKTAVFLVSEIRKIPGR